MTGRPIAESPADAGTGARPPAESGSLPRRWLVRGLALALPFFVLVEVNYPLLSPQSQLALFALFGLALCFLSGSAGGLLARVPAGAETGAGAVAPPRPSGPGWRRLPDVPLALAAIAICGYVVVQTEPLFSGLWLGGTPLGERAGAEARLDVVVGVVGTLLVLEAARRSIGLALPLMALAFVAYAALGPQLPAWLLPHRGYGLTRIVSQGFLHSQGVFGVALKVMFAYVFLFVVFGAVLEATGATGFIIGAVRRLFRNSPGGPAKVAVLSSGLMGSLSGSAVANTATTGTFTIPLMRSAGFAPRVAAGLEAAASSGGALVPPVMGAGAYMMLEIVDPPVSYLAIIRAALIPAILYYLSLYLIVHWGARRLASGDGGAAELARGAPVAALWRWEGLVFVAGLGGLVACLVAGFSVFRSVTVALFGVLALGLAHPRTRLGPRKVMAALESASKAGMPLIAAAACVGIVIGIVTLTGVGTRLPALILPLAQEHLLLALVAIMVSSIVLGMGLPSAVCYLLMATLIGPVLGKLGVVPLAAHLFIFYFGMMSMVTPPVALAAYAASAIAGSRFWETGVAAFRFALAGFALPFLFVLRPQLLLLAPDGGPAPPAAVAMAVTVTVLGIVPLAAAVAGHLLRRSTRLERVLQLLAAVLIVAPAGTGESAAPTLVNAAGALLLAVLVAWQWRTRERG